MISSTATMKPYEISLATGDKAVMCYYERIYRIEGEKEKKLHSYNFQSERPLFCQLCSVTLEPCDIYLAAGNDAHQNNRTSAYLDDAIRICVLQ